MRVFRLSSEIRLFDRQNIGSRDLCRFDIKIEGGGVNTRSVFTDPSATDPSGNHSM